MCLRRLGKNFPPAYLNIRLWMLPLLRMNWMAEVPTCITKAFISWILYRFPGDSPGLATFECTNIICLLFKIISICLISSCIDCTQIKFHMCNLYLKVSSHFWEKRNWCSVLQIWVKVLLKIWFDYLGIICHCSWSNCDFR